MGCSREDCFFGEGAVDVGEPFFAAEPGALAFGVLAGGDDEAFLAVVAGEVAREESADFGDADGFGGGGGFGGEGRDFIDGSVVEHHRGALADAGVEVSG